MKYQISNDKIAVEIEDLGAQLSSVKSADGMEYLWQGDKKYWGDRAPNLFPYIGRMQEKKYIFDGKIHEMDIHGFAKDTVFEVAEKSDNHIIFWMKNTDETYKHYPFTFRFEISYELIDSQLLVTYIIYNLHDREMYFGIGGHPGFNVPIEDGLSFEDYCLEFDEVSKPKRVIFSEDCLVLRTDGEFVMQDGKRIPLSHSIFDDEAIVLGNVAKGVTIKSDKGKKSIRVTYPNMPYVGFWQWPKMDAPYICVEPWSSLPSRKGIIEDLKTQPSLICLGEGEKYQNQFAIEIIEEMS